MEAVQIVIFWIVTPCIFVGVRQRFGGSIFTLNVTIHNHKYHNSDDHIPEYVQHEIFVSSMATIFFHRYFKRMIRNQVIAVTEGIDLMSEFWDVINNNVNNAKFSQNPFVKTGLENFEHLLNEDIHYLQ